MPELTYEIMIRFKASGEVEEMPDDTSLQDDLKDTLSTWAEESSITLSELYIVVA